MVNCSEIEKIWLKTPMGIAFAHFGQLKSQYCRNPFASTHFASNLHHFSLDSSYSVLPLLLATRQLRSLDFDTFSPLSFPPNFDFPKPLIAYRVILR